MRGEFVCVIYRLDLGMTNSDFYSYKWWMQIKIIWLESVPAFWGILSGPPKPWHWILASQIWSYLVGWQTAVHLVTVSCHMAKPAWLPHLFTLSSAPFYWGVNYKRDWERSSGPAIKMKTAGRDITKHTALLKTKRFRMIPELFAPSGVFECLLRKQCNVYWLHISLK